MVGLDILTARTVGALARSKVRLWEVYAVRRREQAIEVEKGVVEFHEVSENSGLAVRVVAEGRLGFSFATEPTAAAVRDMVSRALHGAVHTAQDEFLDLPEPSDGLPASDLGIFDPHLAEIPEGEKIARARELESRALAVDPRVKRVRKAAYSEVLYEARIVNARGVDARHSGTVVAASITVVADDGRDQQQAWDYDFRRAWADLDVGRPAETAARRALALLGARQVPTRKAPLVLDYSVAGDMLGVLVPSLLADNVQKGKSMLGRRLGAEVMAPILTVVDDGLYPRGLATAAVDAEGVPQQRTAVIDGGRLTAYLYDVYTARKDGAHSTGNAQRGSLKALPRVGATNVYVVPGSPSRDDLLRDLGNGFLVTDLLGMHTADTISGDFSVGCSGFWVEGGTIAHPVKGMALAGNILDLFRRVDGVGSDLRFYGHVGCPSLLVGEMTVSGTA